MERFVAEHPTYSHFYAGPQQTLRRFGIDLYPRNFQQVAEQISQNPTMLPKDENALFSRFERGALCALVARNKQTGELAQQVLGTVTMDLLVDAETLQKYFADELTVMRRNYPTYIDAFPALYELGAVDLDPVVRGYKLAHLIHDAVLEPHAENIRRRRTLVVLTTQRPEEVLTVLPAEKPSKNDPLVKTLDFRWYSRGERPGVDVFTCTCTSKTKRGYGIDSACPSAVQNVPRPLRPTMIELISTKNTLLDCYIGISSGDYAQAFSDQVMSLGKVGGAQLTPVEQLSYVVERLRQGRYYD